jgi:DNA-binding GntR family transcriptional regulator
VSARETGSRGAERTLDGGQTDARGDGEEVQTDHRIPFTVARFDYRASLREQITEVLRGAIITGAMRPGELYSGPGLAERFGVSATPVREAMLDLVREGLVDTVRNKGFRVTHLSDTQLDDMTAVRMLIEVPTVADIARRYTPSWSGRIAELREVASMIVTYAENADLIAYVEADRQFHLGLLALAGNDELVTVVGALRARSRLYGLRALSHQGHLARSAGEHAELLNRVTAADADGAGALMRQHIHHVRGMWAGRTEGGSRAE